MKSVSRLGANFDARNHQNAMHRVGWILLIVGIVDIGWMIYAISTDRSYASSFNVFAVVGGLFLLRGSLSIARFVACFSAIFFSAITGVIVALLITFPNELLVVAIRTQSAAYLIGGGVFVAASLILFLWVYMSLNPLMVLIPPKEGRFSFLSFLERPSSGFWLGGLFGFFVLVLVPISSRSDTAKEAIARAEKKYGSAFKYFAPGIGYEYSGGIETRSAEVFIYSSELVRQERFEWQH